MISEGDAYNYICIPVYVPKYICSAIKLSKVCGIPECLVM